MEWFYPVIARYLPEPTGRWPVPLRLYEPTARMRGHQVLARAVQERVDALRARGESPFVLTPTYGLASTLSFYLPGQPETYCLSWNFGMTRQTGQSARPVASQPASRPGCLSGSGRDRRGRQKYAAQLGQAHVPQEGVRPP